MNFLEPLQNIFKPDAGDLIQAKPKSGRVGHDAPEKNPWLGTAR
jgi:hypothetical protein